MKCECMTDAKNQSLQQRLEELLQTLMKSELNQEKELLSTIQELKEIYLDKDGETNGFRHQYSRISSCIFNAKFNVNEGNKSEDTENVEYLNDSAQILANNLAVIREKIKNDKNTKLLIPITKLYDHVNLELLRINYNAILNEDQDAKIDALLVKIKYQDEKLEEKENKVLSKVDDVEEKISSVQKDNVAILAIFAAVIMAFTGGFSFIANSFSGLGSIPLEKLICLTSFIGIILTNLLYALLKFIWSIIKRKEDSNKIPFSVGTLIVINVIFGLIGCIFFALAFINGA